MKRMNTLLSRKGFVGISSIIAMSIFAISAYAFFNTLTTVKKATVSTDRKTIAEFYAAELLELLLSRPTLGLLASLSPNPVNALLPSYKLCSHINLLDRSTSILVNRDPLAELPANTPLRASPTDAAPNRFYMVQVIDLASLNPRKDLCNTPLSAVPALGLTERLYITVGVSWGENGGVRRVAVSGVIP